MTELLAEFGCDAAEGKVMDAAELREQADAVAEQQAEVLKEKTRCRKTRAGGNTQFLCRGVFGVHVCGRVPRSSDNGRSLGSLRQDSVRTDER